MKISRRDFLKSSLVAGAAAGLGTGAGILFTPENAYAFAQTKALPKWVQKLPVLSFNINSVLPGYPELPIASPKSISYYGRPTDYYEIEIAQYNQRLHPQLPKDTTLWGMGTPPKVLRFTAMSGL